MARNGSGTYTKVNTFVAGNTITAAGHNQNWDDVATEITNSVAADGQTSMTGPLKAANGSTANPAFTFASDTDTGFIRSSANSVGVIAGGTQIGQFTTAGLLFTTATFGTFEATATATFGGPIEASASASFGKTLFASATATFKGEIIASATANFVAGFIASATAHFRAPLVCSSSATFQTGLTVSSGNVTLPAGSVANAALAAPGGVVQISTTTTAGATVDFASGLDDTYDHYMLVISNLKPATDDVALLLRVGTGGGPTYQSSGYTYGYLPMSSGTSTGVLSSQSSIVMTRSGSSSGVGNASGESLSGTIQFSNPDGSDYCVFQYDLSYVRADAGLDRVVGSGMYASAGAITGIRLLMSSGNISSLRATLYGFTKS